MSSACLACHCALSTPFTGIRTSGRHGGRERPPSRSGPRFSRYCMASRARAVPRIVLHLPHHAVELGRLDRAEVDLGGLETREGRSPLFDCADDPAETFGHVVSVVRGGPAYSSGLNGSQLRCRQHLDLISRSDPKGRVSKDGRAAPCLRPSFETPRHSASQDGDKPTWVAGSSESGRKCAPGVQSFARRLVSNLM